MQYSRETEEFRVPQVWKKGALGSKCPYEDMDKSDEKKSDGLGGKKSKGPYKAFMVSSLKLSRWHWYIDSGCTTHDISEVMVHNLSTQNSKFHKLSAEYAHKSVVHAKSWQKLILVL